MTTHRIRLPKGAAYCQSCNSLVVKPTSRTCAVCDTPLETASLTKKKYRNQPVLVDGNWFASKKEYRRWLELKLLFDKDIIRHLERQRRFTLVVSSQVVGHYVCDFYYIDVKTGQPVVEDVKSPITRKIPLYILKKKLLHAIYGLTITEI